MPATRGNKKRDKALRPVAKNTCEQSIQQESSQQNELKLNHFVSPKTWAPKDMEKIMVVHLHVA